MNILVTQSDGLLGNAIAQRLLRLPHIHVHAGTCHPERLQPLADAGATVVTVDMFNEDNLRAVISTVDKVVWITPDNAHASHHTDRMLRICSALDNVQQIVLRSHIDAGLDTHHDLGRQYGRSEELLKNCGVPYTIVRTGALAQQLSGDAPWIYQRGDNTFYLPIADSAVAWVDADDVARMIVWTLTSDDAHSQTYTVTGPQALNLHEVANRVGKAVQREFHIAELDRFDYLERMRDHDATEYVIDSATVMLEEMRRGEFATVSDDFPAATGETPTAFDDFITEHTEFWAAQ